MTVAASLASRLTLEPSSLASCLMELPLLAGLSSWANDVIQAIARQVAAAAGNRRAFTPVSPVTVAFVAAIVPAPGVQILRLVNIESQFTGFEDPRLEAMFLGRTQVCGEAVWTESQADGIGG